jgi:hypothetical protein
VKAFHEAENQVSFDDDGLKGATAKTLAKGL